MTLSIITRDITDQSGNLLEGATVTVRQGHEAGGALANLFSDVAGETAISNPVTVASGTLSVYVQPGRYRLEGTSSAGSGVSLVEVFAATQFPTDTTAGRLLKVGDFGLGATVPPEPADMNDITFGSLAGGTANTLNTPLSLAFSAISLKGQNVNNGAQLVVHQGPERVFFRARAGGDFKPWQEFYTRLNVVGNVSQSGGVPTGAIIQQGSNSNGEFVRFADGTQICWVSDFSVSDSGAPSWTYPAGFAAQPRAVAGMMQSGTTPVVLAAGANIGPSSTVVRAWGLSGARVTESASLLAVGRWF